MGVGGWMGACTHVCVCVGGGGGVMFDDTFV